MKNHDLRHRFLQRKSFKVFAGELFVALAWAGMFSIGPFEWGLKEWPVPNPDLDGHTSELSFDGDRRSTKLTWRKKIKIDCTHFFLRLKSAFNFEGAKSFAKNIIQQNIPD